MRIYSTQAILKTSSQFGMAGQIGMEEPFYNDRPLILPDYYKYCLGVLYEMNTARGAMVPSWISGHIMETREIKYTLPFRNGRFDDRFYYDRPMVFIVY